MEPEQNKKDTFLNQLLSMPQDKWDKDRERRALNKDARMGEEQTPARIPGSTRQGLSTFSKDGSQWTPPTDSPFLRSIAQEDRPKYADIGNNSVEGDTGVMHGSRNYPTPFLQNPAISTKEQVTDDAKFPKAPMISAPYQELPKGSSGKSVREDQEAKPLRELFTKENSDMGWQARRDLNQQILANEGSTKVQNSRAETGIETEGMRVQGLKDIENIRQNKAQGKNAQEIKNRESKNLKTQYDLLNTQLNDPLASSTLSPDELSRRQKQREDIKKLLFSSLQTPGQLAQRKAFEDQASKYQ